jgi:hypothetical protein
VCVPGTDTHWITYASKDINATNITVTTQADNWTVLLPNVYEGYEFTTNICNGVSDIQQTAFVNTSTVCAPLYHHIAQMFYTYNTTAGAWIGSTDMVGPYGLYRLVRSGAPVEVYIASEYAGTVSLCTGHWLSYTDPVTNNTYEVSMINSAGR